MFQFDPNAALPVEPERAYKRGRVGALEGFELAHDEMLRTKGQFSIEHNFLETETNLLRDLEAAGHGEYKPLGYFLLKEDLDRTLAIRRERTGDPNMPPGESYEETLRNYPVQSPRAISESLAALFEEGTVRPEVAEAIREYNAQFRNLEGTGFQSIAAKGMASVVLDRANATALRALTDARTSETTTMGSIGYFTGGMFGYLDPRTNPIATATIPFGGVGRTAVTRIGAEAVAQAGIESVIQATGGQETQRRLGLPSGVVPALQEIAMAGVFGGAFQAFGEGARVAVRQMFPRFREPVAAREAPRGGPQVRTAETEAPIPREEAIAREAERRAERGFTGADLDRPYGPAPIAGRRAAVDLQGMREVLGTWDGGTPLRALPTQLRGSTALTSPVDTTAPQFRVARGEDAGPLEIAQLVDPELAKRWTRLTTLRENLRADLQRAGRERVPVAEESIASATARVADLERQVAKLRSDIADTGKKSRRQKLRRVLAEKEAQLEDAAAARVEAERAFVDADGDLTRMAPTPREQDIRQRLIKTDEQLRDLIPLFSRAAAAERGEFRMAGAAPKLEDLIRAADNGDPYESAIAKAIDEFNAAETAMRADPSFPEPAPVRTAEEIKASVDEPDMRLESEVAALRAQVAEEGTEFVQVSGRTLRLDDKITVPVEEGEGSRTLTVREFIDEIDAEDDLVAAFTTCRIG